MNELKFLSSREQVLLNQKKKDYIKEYQKRKIKIKSFLDAPAKLKAIGSLSLVFEQSAMGKINNFHSTSYDGDTEL